MRSDHLSMLILIFLFGCSQKNTNVPGAAPEPAPVRTGPESIVHADCGSRFRHDMNLAEIAASAGNMRLSCGYSEEQIYNLAKKTFK